MTSDSYTTINEQPSPVFPYALGSSLRPYVQLVLQLDDAEYAPTDIAGRVGLLDRPLSEVGPQIPDADVLVRELMQLRLLEPLANGRYRRWEFLADETEDDVLRYVALTLLIPRTPGSSGYVLPALRLPLPPFLGSERTEALPPAMPEWAPDETLIAWYEEAGLLERTADGPPRFAYRSLLALMDYGTPMARVLSTFLTALKQVQESQQQYALLEHDALPVLDIATLEERIADIQRELLIDRTTILRIYRSLVAGQHVILSGPPGTGKTHLAIVLPHILWHDSDGQAVLDMPTDPARPPDAPPIERPFAHEGYRVELVTATEDWSVRHVIGGIVPNLTDSGLSYAVRHGCLAQAVLDNYGGSAKSGPLPQEWSRHYLTTPDGRRYRGCWLVIDELTRAPIDSAFGGALTALGGGGKPLMVLDAAGREVPVPLPRDFRIIATLNSFDRHFLHQMSEAMKRRFTFIDVLPPARDHADAEQAIAVYRALLRLGEQRFPGVLVDAAQGVATWEGVLRVTRSDPPTGYRLELGQEPATHVLATFWRLFSAVRVYRQLGTAQAEAVYTALISGRQAGMAWEEALDTALADTLADQLQVLARDEQRVVLAFLTDAADTQGFVTHLRDILSLLPLSPLQSHLRSLCEADPTPGDSPIDERNPDLLTAAQVGRVFALDEPLLLPADGAFARRLRHFINERGL